MSTLLDPKQALCLANYKDPKSDTFGNMYQSALLAGYPEVYARQITGKKPDWLMDNIVTDVKRVVQAEKNLDKYNDYKLDPDEIKTKRDIELAKLQTDVSKFILKTQARAKYSEDKEVTPPNVQINIINYKKGDNVTVHEAQGEPLDVPLDTSITE